MNNTFINDHQSSLIRQQESSERKKVNDQHLKNEEELLHLLTDYSKSSSCFSKIASILAGLSLIVSILSLAYNIHTGNN